MPVNLERRALVALGLLWLGGVRAGAAVDVTGVWSEPARGGGRDQMQMVFTPTHATLISGMLFDATYEIDASKIKLVFAPLPETHVFDFTIAEDTLTVISAEGKSDHLTRIGAPHHDAHPIVGDWAPRVAGKLQFAYRFSRLGLMQSVLSFTTSTRPYRIEGERIHFDGKPSLTRKIRREGNVLITQNATGKDVKLVKFEY